MPLARSPTYVRSHCGMSERRGSLSAASTFCLSWTLSWVSYSFLMVFLWFSYGFPMVFLGLKLQENRKKTGRKPKENQKKTGRNPKENQKKTEENRRKPEEKKTTAPPFEVFLKGCSTSSTARSSYWLTSLVFFWFSSGFLLVFFWFSSGFLPVFLGLKP